MAGTALLGGYIVSEDAGTEVAFDPRAIHLLGGFMGATKEALFYFTALNDATVLGGLSRRLVSEKAVIVRVLVILPMVKGMQK